MGIHNLLQVLKNVTKCVNINSLKGMRVAVDGYYWLHRGAYACSKELCTNVPTTRYLSYCLGMIDFFQGYNITPIIVFDGSPLPSKKGEEADREARRKENLTMAIEAQRMGDREKAKKHYDRAVDITPKMAFEFIEQLKLRGVEYIVAPFEADAQLAFLSREGIVDAVIAEDSDMIPYGVNCVVNKVDKNTNSGKMICLKDVMTNSEFKDFTIDMIRQTCILSGCDYLKSPKNFGPMKAIKLMKKSGDGFTAIRNIRFEGKYELSPDYEKEFQRAELTFKHQQVYDPRIRQVVPLTPLPPNLKWDDLEPFLGQRVPEDIGRAIAEGVIDPITRVPFAAATGGGCGGVKRVLSSSSSSSFMRRRNTGNLSRMSSYNNSFNSIDSVPRCNSASVTLTTGLSLSSSSLLSSTTTSSSSSSLSTTHSSSYFASSSSLSTISSSTSSSSTGFRGLPSIMKSSSPIVTPTATTSLSSSLNNNSSSPFLTPSALRRKRANPLTTSTPPTQKDLFSFFKPAPKKTLTFEEEEKDKEKEDEEDNSNSNGFIAGHQPYIINTSSKALRQFVPPSKKIPKLSSTDSDSNNDNVNDKSVTTEEKSMLIKSRFFNRMSKENEFIAPLKHQVISSSSSSSSLLSQKKNYKSMNDIINCTSNYNSYNSVSMSTTITNSINTNTENTVKKHFSENNLNVLKKREREEEIPEIHSPVHKTKENSFLGNSRLTLLLNNSSFKDNDDEDVNDDDSVIVVGGRNHTQNNDVITIDDSNSDDNDDIEDDSDDDDDLGFHNVGTQRIDGDEGEEDVKSQTPQPQQQQQQQQQVICIDDDDTNDENNESENNNEMSERDKMLDRINSYLFKVMK